MSIVAIAFEARRCPAGYLAYDFPDELPDKRLMAGERPGRYIRPRNKEMQTIPIDVRDLSSPVCVAFANGSTEQGLLDFANAYGLPGGGPKNIIPAGRGESVEALFVMAAFIRGLLDLAVGDDPDHARYAINKEIKSSSDLHAMPMLEFSAKKSDLTMALRPTTLWGVMLFELALIACGSPTLHSCLNCGTLFLTGLHTGRKGHAKFCSDACRVAHNLRKKATSRRS